MHASDVSSSYSMMLKCEFPTHSYPLLPIPYENFLFQSDPHFSHQSEDKADYCEEASTLSPHSKKICKKNKKELENMPEAPKTRKVRNLWKKDEDALLLELVAKYGPKWTLIGKTIGGRACKQVRDRYNNHLRPNINNSPFTAEEDDLLISLYQKYGSKWCKISKEMAQRTEAQVKNRFYLCLKDKLKAKSNSLMISKNVSAASRSTSQSENDSFSPMSNGFVVKEDDGFGFISYN